MGECGCNVCLGLTLHVAVWLAHLFGGIVIQVLMGVSAL